VNAHEATAPHVAMTPKLLFLALGAIGIAACGGGTATSNSSNPPTGSSTTTAASTSAATAGCPSAYKQQTVDLTGTVSGTPLQLGSKWFITVKDYSGNTCQVVTPTNPGQESVSLHAYVAFPSPGNQPSKPIAYPVYEMQDRSECTTAPTTPGC
jgi:hypothetical protein